MTKRNIDIPEQKAVSLRMNLLSPFKIRSYGHNRNTQSVSETPKSASASVPQITDSASDSRRRKHETALSLFPKFNAFITRTETCWLWTAGKDAYGYGQIAVPKHSPMKTHRLAWLFAHGEIPERAHVLHKCDVRNCVNPDHLFLGDQAANMKDAAAKGRLHAPRPNGRKVSDAAIAAIIAAPAVDGVTVQLARQYGVSQGFVSLVRSGQRRAVPSPAPAASSVVPASRPQPQPSTIAEGQA